MTEDFDELAGLDSPRSLPASLRSRLEQLISQEAIPPPTTQEVLAEAAALATGEPLEELSIPDDLDAPREVPPALRARLFKVFGKKPRWVPNASGTAIAVASVLLLIVGGLVLGQRLGDRSDSTVTLSDPAIVEDNLPAHKAPPIPPPPGSLRKLTSDSEFLQYVKAEGLRIVTADGLGFPRLYSDGSFAGRDDPFIFSPPRRPAGDGGAVRGEQAPQPAPAFAAAESSGPPSFSTTNVQEAGVDEPDQVKTDGKRVAYLARNRLYIFEMDSGVPKAKGSIEIPNPLGLLWIDDRVVVFSYGFDPEAPTRVSFVDISKTEAPKVVAQLDLQGNYVGARMAKGVVRLVVQSFEAGPELVQPQSGARAARSRALTSNRKAIRDSNVGDWIPKYRLTRPGRKDVSGLIHGGDDAFVPPEPAGLSMLTVFTLNPSDPSPDNAVSVIGAGEIVYSSIDNLYVTTSRWTDLVAARQGGGVSGTISRIHKFDIGDPSLAQYRASGEVPGFLLNQFSLSESQGHLRVASTLGTPGFGGPRLSESFVTVLNETGGRLTKIGSVGNLGKGERIYSVRFIGSRGYVVTFRQTDPLYVVDLSAPAAPKVTGELKVEGYSGYLHPVPGDKLVGVGRDATAEGRLGGAQLSLFDVSNSRQPRRLDKLVFGQFGGSQVEDDHLAFLYWDPRKLVVIPLTTTSFNGQESEYFGGAIAVRVSASSRFGEPVRLTHDGRRGAPAGSYPVIHRSIVVGDTLLTFSEAGVLASDLDNLADRSWLPLGAL